MEALWAVMDLDCLFKKLSKGGATGSMIDGSSQPGISIVGKGWVILVVALDGGMKKIFRDRGGERPGRMETMGSILLVRRATPFSNQ